METTTIQEALEPVVGLPLRCIGRAANMLWLHFGEMREVKVRSGGRKSVGDWAIHVQCPWRISRLGRIVIAYHDFYKSPDGDALDDLDTSGRSRFDSMAARLCTEFETTSPVVGSVAPDDVGGFSVRFSRNYRLDVFPAASDDSSEHWRVFQTGATSKHFVFRKHEKDLV